MAPMPVKARDRDNGAKTDETLVLFKTVPVFSGAGPAAALRRADAA
jgi:hypothetical protein